MTEEGGSCEYLTEVERDLWVISLVRATTSSGGGSME